MTLSVFCLALPNCAPDPQSRAPGGEAARWAFANAVNQPPPGWSGPVFQLSRDYPAEQPAPCSREECPWLSMDVTFTSAFDSVPPDWQSGPWNDYIGSVLAYVREGQDPQLSNEAGFRVDVNGSTRWYHVPWMAYDPTAGREFVHGTTNERTAHVADLVGDGVGVGTHTFAGMPQKCVDEYPNGFETWSVGFYNQFGGWSLGQTFGPDGLPNIGSFMGSAVPAGLPFPTGTVVAKVLTTTAPIECAPFLAGSPEWQVNRHTWAAGTGYSCERQVQVSRIVQLDVAVVDPRSPSRWVYGTFAYDGSIDAESPWDRLVPVGLQWGSDPLAFPAVPRDQSRPVVQSVLNTGIGTPQHFGCNNRLAGPVDNPASSCTSCHGSAFAAADGAISMMGTNVPASFGFPGLCEVNSADNVNYFQNLVYPMSYAGGAFPDALNLDTSLQLEVAFTSYGYFNTQGKPQACTNPNQFGPA